MHSSLRRWFLARLPACLFLYIYASGILAVAADRGTAKSTHLLIEASTDVLEGKRSASQLLATAIGSEGFAFDVTRDVAWSTSDSTVISVEPGARLIARGEGRAQVIARLGSLSAARDIEVRHWAEPRPVHFEHEVLPALSKAGCNQGACHGTPTGKNGFRLSLRGFDPKLDFQTLARELGDRRTNPIDPAASLILLKGTGTIEHQGGQRMTRQSLPYRLLRDWIAEGLQPAPPDSPRLVRIEVLPSQRVLHAPARIQQLAVRAYFSNGAVRDVTRLARYTSSEESVAEPDVYGLVRHRKRGEVTVLVHYENQVATSRLIFLEPVAGLVWSPPPEHNFIDREVFAKLKLLQLPPSDLADDATFLRRVTLDTIGLVPTADEVRKFLADEDPAKRTRLIDTLLERPEFVDFWALKWADRLGCNQRFVGLKGAFSYHRWIRDQVAANVPFDKFVRAIVTASGPNYTSPPASFYRRLRTPDEAAESVSQLFLGVRMQCAKCHNHPAERWTQDDYYGMAACFSQVRFKNGPQFHALYNKEETVFLVPQADVVQPRTGQTMVPKPLGGAPLQVEPGQDRRKALADWLVSPANPFFAKAAVNRIWYHLFGRGIVEPVDDLRESNPAASAELLQALADDFVAHGYDMKHTIRLILNSRTYQLSSRPNAWNADDSKYFSHAIVRLLSAEQLLDAASRITDVPERLFQLPPGTRAAQIPDGEFPHPFLRTFGQPSRSVACECERGNDSTLEQALQTVGGRTFHAKLTAPENRLGRLLGAGASDAAIVDELFLWSLGRFPDPSERALAVSRLKHAVDRRRAAEDVLWSLLNHPEFLFQH